MKEENGKTEENGKEEAEKKEEKKEKVKKKRSFRSFSFLRREKKHKEAKEAKDKNGDVSTVFVWVPACCVGVVNIELGQPDPARPGSTRGAGSMGCMSRQGSGRDGTGSAPCAASVARVVVTCRYGPAGVPRAGGTALSVALLTVSPPARSVHRGAPPTPTICLAWERSGYLPRDRNGGRVAIRAGMAIKRTY